MLQHPWMSIELSKDVKLEGTTKELEKFNLLRKEASTKFKKTIEKDDDISD